MPVGPPSLTRPPFAELVVCDRCGEDFHRAERACGRVVVPFRDVDGKELEGTMLCGNCVGDFEATGCYFRRSGQRGDYFYHPLGQHEPPEDWLHPRPGWRDVLEALCGPITWERESDEWPDAGAFLRRQT